MAQKCEMPMPVSLHTNLSSIEFCLNGSKMMSYLQSVVKEDKELTTVGSFLWPWTKYINTASAIEDCSNMFNTWVKFPQLPGSKMVYDDPGVSRALWEMMLTNTCVKSLMLENCEVNQSICKSPACPTYTHRTNLMQGWWSSEVMGSQSVFSSCTAWHIHSQN